MRLRTTAGIAWRRWLGALCVLSFVIILIVAVGARAERSSEVELARYTLEGFDPVRAGTRERLHINGLSVDVTYSAHPEAPRSVLDRLERECADRSARFDGTGEGTLLCGRRFVYARGRDSSLLVAFDTFSVDELGYAFPPIGDVPGVDLPGVPRPRHARRTSSVSVEGSLRRSVGYTISQSPERVGSRMRTRLRDGGWSLAGKTELRHARSGVPGPLSRSSSLAQVFRARRAGRVVDFVIGPDPDGTALTVFESGGD